MEILAKLAREYRAAMLSPMEFRLKITQHIGSADFSREDVEKLVTLLLQNALAE
jgi:hypothetical protein